MKAYILTNDRQLVIKKVNPSKLWFYYRGKLYDLDPTAIVMDEHADKVVRSQPRLIYFENSAEPMRFTDAPALDPSQGYLEKYIKLNSVRTQNKPSLLSKLGPVFERLAGMFTIQNFMIILITGSMLYSFLRDMGVI